MTVGNLKTLLESIENDTRVLVYSGISEDGDIADGIGLYKNTLKDEKEECYGKNLPYVKGDWPSIKEGEKVLVIGGYSEYWPDSDA